MKLIGKYRWTICALVFIATTINYYDRQVLTLLKDSLEIEFNWSDSDYANIVAVFQFAYAISMLLTGRLIDWIGTKKGYALALIVWTVGAIVQAFARTTGGFMIARGILGFGEAANFPAAIKTIAEWFPKKERSLATGIFNSGTTVGAIIAPLTIPLLAEKVGWQWTFIITGAIGLLWLIFWFWLYEKPGKSKNLSKEEFNYIHIDSYSEEQSISTSKTEKVSWGQLFKYKQTWAFAFGKFMTDGVWWFFLFWLPSYLKAQYGMTGTQVAIPLAVLYTMSIVGSIGGGWFPMYFINKGNEPYAGRMKAMLTIAIIPVIVLLAQPLGGYSYWLPVLIIGIGTSAHQAWSANLFTTVSDMFPNKAVASVVGIGGMIGGIGGIVVNKSAGWLFDSFRSEGIAKAWNEVSLTNMSDFAKEIRGLKLLNNDGMPLLNHVELGNLSKSVALKLQSIDPETFRQLKEFQAKIVLDEMTTAYTIMFAFCALSYLVAWAVMKTLVPKFKPITDL